MKLRLLAILASTALAPMAAMAQTPQQNQSQTQQSKQAATASDFVTRAAMSNMFEIQSSQLAQEKSQNDRVRQFAEKMIQDHTAAGDKLKATAQGIQGITVPTNLDQQHAQMVQTLRSAAGQDFDRRYVQLQVSGHQDAVALFEQYAQNGDNAQLKQFAQQTLPTLREHLQSIQQIRNALPPAQVGEAQDRNGQQTAQAQGGQDASRIVVQQPAPAVRVDQASPQVMVQQQQPNVTVRQPQPEILVHQPQPTVTVDIPQPEITVRMPQPDVNVAMAPPQVQVNQPKPQVQVVQPQQPQVEVEPAQPHVTLQRQADARPNVQVQRPADQPVVRYERAEPRVVVNQPKGEPQVRVERMAQGEQNQQAGTAAQPSTQQAQANQAGQQQAAADRSPAAASTTGALPAAQAVAVSRLDDMNLYNARGNELGDVERVVQGQDGKQYLVVGAGGFLGIGERKVAIPTERVALQGDRLIVQGMTEDQIRSMPAFGENSRSFRKLDDNQQVQINPMR